MKSSAYKLVETPEAWQGCLEILRREPRIAVDLEANSLFAYQESICLLQVSTAERDFIIDPLAGFPLSGMGEVLADPAIEKVFHASSYDLLLLKRHYGWEVNNLFDTMWAARVLGYTSMGLAGLLKEFYGVTLSKKYQKANWAARPIAEALLDYARMDTHYLLRLRDDLAARLDAAGRLEEALEIFDHERRVVLEDRNNGVEGFWSVRGARRAAPQARAILRVLYAFRDEEARRRNLPSFKVFSDAHLLLLAEHAPANAQELRNLEGFSPKLADRYGPRILAAIAKSRHHPPPPLPEAAARQPREIVKRYRLLQHWRKETAQNRGVESDVVMPRDILWEIARRNPRTSEELAAVPGLGSCRRALYAEGLLRALAQVPENAETTD